MNELEELLRANGLGRALERHGRIPELEVQAVEGWLRERDGSGGLTAGARAGLLRLATERVWALTLDETFVEAGCERALEPHPRVGLMPIPMLWGLVTNGEAAAVIAWGKERHQEITLEEKDRFRYGWRGDPLRTRELGGGWKRAADAIAAIKRANPRNIPKILCMGGNGSSKSEFGAWWAVKLMVEKPRAQVAVLCPSQTQARKVLMSRIYNNLPVEWRPDVTGKMKTGITGNISYSEKMGFTENMFILPNGSRCTFYFYLEGDPASIEGDQLDLVLADEEVPVEWLEAVEYRLARTGGTLMAMFTPISGYIPAVSWFRGNARVIEERAAPLLKSLRAGVGGEEEDLERSPDRLKAGLQYSETDRLKAGLQYSETDRTGSGDPVTLGAGGAVALGAKRQVVPAWFDGPEGVIEEGVMMPLAEYGADATKRIVYFWTEDCCYPQHGYETLVQLLKGKRASANEVKTRAYGWPSKVKDARFPILSEAVHAMSPERAAAGGVPEGCTWYQWLDPAEGRNHVMQWYAKTKDGREILVREWPQQDDYIPGVGQPGPWAEDAKRGKALDGVPGPGQESWGLTTEQYVQEMDRIEVELARVYEKRTDGQPIKVHRREMDSRGGEHGMDGKTYFTEFARCKRFFCDASGKALNARSDNPDGVCGISLISDALGYDTQKPVGPGNRPRLVIVYAPPNMEAGEEVPRGCANTWDSLKNWTGADGLKGARKDFIDLCHYAQRAEMRWVSARSVAERNAAAWGGYGS